MIPEPILNLAEICAQKQVLQIVLSPGSRCAPLTLSFVRHPSLTTRVISDERSAAYIAMGLALETKRPSVLICTSGTAALNYSPAVAEAFFQQIPLILLTSDRPPEWIEQQDGQTIYQDGLYGKHVKKSYQLPVSTEHQDAKWQTSRIINEAINLSCSYPKGPVHINVPLREPLYSSESGQLLYDKTLKIINLTSYNKTISLDSWNRLTSKWDENENKLILIGQSSFDPGLQKALNLFCQSQRIPVISEITSNLPGLNSAIQHGELLLRGVSKLKPDLLITAGQSIVSKRLKQFIRNHKPKEHWHIAPDSSAPDTFQCLTEVVPTEAGYFFSELHKKLEKPVNSHYYDQWHKQNTVVKSVVDEFLSTAKFSELTVVRDIIQRLPTQTNLILANSMPIRWANIIGLCDEQKEVKVYANRGTGGIDGSNSTAVGITLASSKTTILITGDMAFFYDRNAFWHHYKMPNLRIILLNNHGGVIFRLIEGPSDQPELQDYFETDQRLSAENTAKDFNFEYSCCTNQKSLDDHLKTFFNSSDKTKLLEIEISKTSTKETFTELQNLIAKAYE